MAKSGTKLCPVDLSSDVPPSRGHLVANSSTNLGPVDLSSHIPSNKNVNFNREKVFENA